MEQAIRIIDRNEGIFRSGRKSYYVEMSSMLYPNDFIRNVINSMTDIFTYYSPDGSDSKGFYSRPEPDDIMDMDIIEFILEHEENWKPLQDE